LIAGLVAVGLIGAVSIFAADPKNQDIVDIRSLGQTQNPQNGAAVGQDFAIDYTFKPRAGLKLYNLRVTLDGQPIENRRWENSNGASGTQAHDYEFRYGMNAQRTQREKGFDWTLLRPGTHLLVVRACHNNVPSTSCKQLTRKELTFTVPNQGTGQSAKAIAIGNTSLTVGSFTAGSGPITAASDSRIKSNVVSPAQLEEERDPQKGNAVEPPLQGDELNGDNAGNSIGIDKAREVTSLVDTVKNRLSMTEVAHAALRNLQVQVNPIGLTPAFTWVEISPANCVGGSTQTVPGGGIVRFTCGDTNHSAIAHPGAFKNGNQNCTATVQSGPVNNNVNLYYGCIADAIPAPPAGGGGSGGGGGGTGGGGSNPGNPRDDKAQVKVWVNPRPAMKGVDVTIKGGGCGDKKTVGDGEVIFGNCRVGDTVTVTLPKHHTSDGWDYQLGNDNDTSESRTFKVARVDANNVVEFNYYGGQTGIAGGGTAPIKVWVNPIGKTPDRTEVSIRGGLCNDKNGNPVYNQKKMVGSDGTVTFGNCAVGAGYIVSVPNQFTDDEGFVWMLGPNGQERKLDHLSNSPSGVPSWVPEYHYTLDDGDAGDIVRKPAPIMALRSLSPNQAIVDLFKFGAGPDFNIGQVKQVKATVDGQVTDDHTPPVPAISVGGQNKTYKYFPTIKNEPLNLGNLADGKAHTITLQAISTAGAVRTMTINVEATDTAPPTPAPTPTPVATPTPVSSATPTPNPSATPGNNGAINALVYNDKNGNGKRESGEDGVSGVSVTNAVVTAPGQTGASSTAKTNDQGSASFSKLANGGYLVKAATPAGYGATTPVGLDVDVNNDTKNLEFGIQQLASPTPIASEGPQSTPTVNAPGEKGSGQTKGILGNLPKTGQAGLILFLTFLVASGIYYGGRKLVAKRHQK
jgi:hypothetical protein